ncbi:hypothetical protein A3D84_03010 [Candidatus Woesebacteria bacterium RIFCSPHIGHO2_02_FULL_42_20]|uniref:Uncharacterized protein n=1 Tax=Candidatus Woesebacteria bacterium RIFCSPHIGHO2_12_FULL_41_24 TaxID=1802510 RepID=A0A1F8AS36_9BACT|nr:MAG: hypothetical protein A2W15_03200 [Candidatus Woesebacteria bacterium RBG_16_41_13]OGM30547.1 MAG: hypothetical protein A2873_05510 [Candidatus Woesebacteria bacterium RIFCSPHIGHO2_01_FULL_42_80]OGM34811.1 MAG: hypothetical protein A3D84_03010 [Candidatus Woesebacteria bacterium RIFCSPHIGHO2_02_FULL_42_20]OGM54440.1 MAG: hypothetical protein A3E44_00045 [Candidatus Woesebacteria bacterium RIFCSPHIGHO2_12_FULL_41_24]OGM68060.1 MAG: hypothetical protein A2969_05130 [Candidatus Woesebacteri
MKRGFRKARETLEVYAPLAESLGMYEVKTLLEDLAFAHIAPDQFVPVKRKVDQDPRLDDKFLAYWISRIQAILDEKGIKG